MAKIPINDWLYRNSYDDIYEKFLVSLSRGSSLSDWLSKYYPKLWKSYKNDKTKYKYDDRE